MIKHELFMISTPLGHVCHCPSGMHMNGTSTCSEDHPCDQWGTCSQSCSKRVFQNRSPRNHHKCYCHEDYYLEQVKCLICDIFSSYFKNIFLAFLKGKLHFYAYSMKCLSSNHCAFQPWNLGGEFIVIYRVGNRFQSTVRQCSMKYVPQYNAFLAWKVTGFAFLYKWDVVKSSKSFWIWVQYKNWRIKVLRLQLRKLSCSNRSIFVVVGKFEITPEFFLSLSTSFFSSISYWPKMM